MFFPGDRDQIQVILFFCERGDILIQITLLGTCSEKSMGRFDPENAFRKPNLKARIFGVFFQRSNRGTPNKNRPVTERLLRGSMHVVSIFKIIINLTEANKKSHLHRTAINYLFFNRIKNHQLIQTKQ